ncbi:MAG: hypothetical protein OEW67_08170 [Cyclobacteriaceae bacterium]|nr:hypothetical protein [Cyclobacteriaceae bacterium]
MFKKLYQFTLVAILLAFTIFASGCDEFCGGTSEEPVIEIAYQAGGNVTSVYAVKDGVELPPIEGASGTFFNIPVDINGSSVTYNFVTTQGNHTMQIFYDPVSELQSFECGFRFSIENLRLGSTTFTGAIISGGPNSFINYLITIQ